MVCQCYTELDVHEVVELHVYYDITYNSLTRYSKILQFHICAHITLGIIKIFWPRFKFIDLDFVLNLDFFDLCLIYFLL